MIARLVRSSLFDVLSHHRFQGLLSCCICGSMPHELQYQQTAVVIISSIMFHFWLHVLASASGAILAQANCLCQAFFFFGSHTCSMDRLGYRLFFCIQAYSLRLDIFSLNVRIFFDFVHQKFFISISISYSRRQIPHCPISCVAFHQINSVANVFQQQDGTFVGYCFI